MSGNPFPSFVYSSGLGGLFCLGDQVSGASVCLLHKAARQCRPFLLGFVFMLTLSVDEGLQRLDDLLDTHTNNVSLKLKRLLDIECHAKPHLQKSSEKAEAHNQSPPQLLIHVVARPKKANSFRVVVTPEELVDFQVRVGTILRNRLKIQKAPKAKVEDSDRKQVQAKKKLVDTKRESLGLRASKSLVG